MPSTVSTPPRKRIRAKTMTSASASAGTSSTRRSALRNGKNGDRDKPKPVLKDKKNKKNKKERKEKKEKDKKDRKDKQGKHEDQKREKKENEERKKEKKENEERKKEKKEKAEQGEKKLAKIQAEKAKAKAEEEKKLAKIQAEKAKAKAEEEKLAKIQAEKAKAKAEEEKLAKIQAEKAKAKAEEEKKVAKIQAEKAKAKAEEEKKVAKAKTEEEKKATKTKENGKDEKKIRFEPAKRRKIQHIFNTPERKKRAERSPARSVAETSAGSLTSKEKAEKRLAELQSLLKASDIDDDSSCPATDMEEFLEDIKMQTEKRHPVQRGPEDEELEEAEEEAETEDEEEEEETEAQEEEKAEDQMDSSDCSDSFDGSEVEDEDEEEETEKEEDEGKPEDKETDPKKELALVACTQEAETTNEKLRNSSTNKREWDTFCRQAKSAGKMPVSLSEFYVTSKVELFNMWLDAEKDWDTCVLEVERIQSQRNISKRGWVAIQGKELKKRYDTEEKWEKVRADRVAKGLYYQDDDFPDDALESQRIIYV